MSKVRSRRPKFLGSKLKSIRDRYKGSSLIQEDFASIIKQCLKAEFAESYPEISREYISGYERGTRTVPPVVLLAYAHLANIFVEVLIDDRLTFPVDCKFPMASKFSGIKVSK